MKKLLILLSFVSILALCNDSILRHSDYDVRNDDSRRNSQGYSIFFKVNTEIANNSIAGIATIVSSYIIKSSFIIKQVYPN